MSREKQLNRSQEVVGSIPISSTTNRSRPSTYKLTSCRTLKEKPGGWGGRWRIPCPHNYTCAKPQSTNNSIPAM